ncbi:lycopene cyclase domain-containing protein [uncultured Marinobacter sp.]|jgi:hypothetical protein|uniref:lycopene cyclase domain-containing protein n=1 Tax=uncultured Marinobacter sp. TaxID=187379 RepID=UPI0032B0F6DB|tara:strand:+ start:540 stop:1271 length:732 start_codon:yes stop_codon:yes gene_type:complete
MLPFQYTWLIWSSTFLIPWIALFVAYPHHRRVMWRSSLATMPFGLTEPLFVPEYWNPPSLFSLAQQTGFDIESLIFCFAIGGIGVVLYNIITGQQFEPLPRAERARRRHRHHKLVLASPFIVFIVLVGLPWNAIYPGIIAMAVGAAASIWCRPDLKRKTWIGGSLFLAYYVVFLVGLELMAPGYIDQVWKHDVLTGLHIAGFPIEEILFAFTFGMYWTGAYEHVAWNRAAPARPSRPVVREGR